MPIVSLCDQVLGWNWIPGSLDPWSPGEASFVAVKENGGLVTWGDESQAASSVLPRVPDVHRLLDLGKAELWESIGIQCDPR